MKKYLSTQIYCKTLECSFEIIEKVFDKSEIIIECFESPTVKIKRFLGSKLNIDGSGYLWQGKNRNTFSVMSSLKCSYNFAKFYCFKITYINELIIKEDISIDMNIYRNTHDNSTFIEFCFIYISDNNYINWIKNKLLEFELKDFIQNGCNNLNYYVINSSEFSTIYHSMLVNMNYKKAYKIFRNFYNTAKVLGVDKSWKIKYENNSIYSVNMNNGINMDFHIYKEEENASDGSKSIFYHKFKDKIPSLNEWIKGQFFYISKDKCFLVHESKIPSNINCNLYNTINNFVLYVLRKWRIFVETQQNSLFVEE